MAPRCQRLSLRRNIEKNDDIVIDDSWELRKAVSRSRILKRILLTRDGAAVTANGNNQNQQDKSGNGDNEIFLGKLQRAKDEGANTASSP